ncbi:MAG: EamA family transporter [Clostridiaceae bacterium]|nr:EamA family transporter [Clostridiaceae bacterium]
MIVWIAANGILSTSFVSSATARKIKTMPKPSSSQPSKLFMFIGIQVLMFIFSTASMMTKVASFKWRDNGFWSVPFLLTFGAAIALTGIYAIFWQKILKRVDLSIAYMSKGVTLFWTLFWSVLIFDESVTLRNVIGLIFIFVGIAFINRDEAKKKDHVAEVNP